ncbi:hypothetical protein D910_04226 [Dendroctonus ponderosae]|uniref:Sodium/potassium-transporting ATPase subunit beta n=1 Tax=Dendroctonus ponderosae TaxID=77166 RepID=U4U189_DENPD|nr:hypothetical protein D910_04226 [Dendroctonus ponderosae]
MQGLFATLNDKEPTWTLDKSWIGTNPGLGVRPVSNRFEEGSLIWYNMTNQTQIGKWVHLINDFLARKFYYFFRLAYNASQTGTNYVNCDFDKPPGEGQVCATDLSKLGNCNHGRAYGYNSSSPCIFLKLNRVRQARIIGWEPEYYTTAQADMPDELKIHIQNNTSSELEKKQVWVSCQGVDTIDRQHVKEFRYYPQGFASYYYPYRNYPNYLSPIVAVEVINLTRKYFSI